MDFTPNVRKEEPEIAHAYFEGDDVIVVYDVPAEITARYKEMQYVRPKGTPNNYGVVFGLSIWWS